ncbi:MAG TPA: hypothetical protein VJN43_00200 [Bryobacteraceae bacterium]|nr:hypothetical protein [Bryobacteraceae bacterium]
MREFHRLIRVPLAAGLLLLASQPARAEGTKRDPSAKRTERALRKWLDALSFAESGNRSWIVHRDRDGRDYYGCLQFRLTTFQYYVDKFDLAPDAEEDEVIDLIYDCAFQKRLATRMLRDNPDNWKHWRGTVKRIGLPPGSSGALDRAAAAPPHNLEVDNRKAVTQ